jgi:tRNA (guanine26-N2/guanine27-N2)-dimethyltransferase
MTDSATHLDGSTTTPSSKKRKKSPSNGGDPLTLSSDNAGKTDTGTTTTITEGSAMMSFPADQESTVFYNPVQVQNRDLSVLMISLYAERRAIRRAVQQRKKELMQQGGNTGECKGNDKLTKEELQTKLTDYEASLDVQKLLLEDAKDDGVTILDALAASGLRSIRYWKEIPGVKHVTINDLDEAAIDRAKDNLKRNNLHEIVVDDNSDRRYGICVQHGDATHELYMARRPQQLRNYSAIQARQQPMWDVIDLDPYGSAAPFLDGAVQAVESGGLLCVTCTDMAALGGSHPETAYGRYASLPIQSSNYLQELALRILLHTIAVSAARYGRSVRPVLSVGMAFYVRVFVEIHNDKKGVTDLSLNLGNVYQSTKCSTFVVLPHGQMGGKKGNVYQSNRLIPSVCPETGAPFKVGGPLWIGPLHDPSVVQVALQRLSEPTCRCPNMELIATRERLLGLLTSVSEEIQTPLYYTLPDLCRVMHCSSPPLREFKAAIMNAGYSVSGYHKEANAIKTDAPSHVVWDVMRAWLAKNPPHKEPAADSPASKILSTNASIEVDFSVRSSDSGTARSKVARFPLNPEKHWGPKRKASGKQKPNEDVVGEDDT